MPQELGAYIGWIRADGLIVDSLDKTSTSAFSRWLDYAINEHGQEAVKREIVPLVPELVKTTHRRTTELYSEDTPYDTEQRERYQAFFDAFEKGQPIRIGPFEFRKDLGSPQ